MDGLRKKDYHDYEYMKREALQTGLGRYVYSIWFMFFVVKTNKSGFYVQASSVKSTQLFNSFYHLYLLRFVWYFVSVSLKKCVNIRILQFVGEKGEPAILPPGLQKEYDALYKVNGFNGRLSDEIALNRSIKDIRHPKYVWCVIILQNDV